jgi:hypothetical protein
MVCTFHAVEPVGYRIHGNVRNDKGEGIRRRIVHSLNEDTCN